ncbi:hypothetical protein L917_07291 [Phytophthora nicotianae]|uniref:Secreted protein n=1 Tax=Phytophthora nicotianae TaxID=4792 RepID=W2LBQ9_PHYNI|nr:hypothetical protein L917_07291 [Phytophthora nicotianae]
MVVVLPVIAVALPSLEPLVVLQDPDFVAAKPLVLPATVVSVALVPALRCETAVFVVEVTPQALLWSSPSLRLSLISNVLLAISEQLLPLRRVRGQRSLNHSGVRPDRLPSQTQSSANSDRRCSPAPLALLVTSHHVAVHSLLPVPPSVQFVQFVTSARRRKLHRPVRPVRVSRTHYRSVNVSPGAH